MKCGSASSALAALLLAVGCQGEIAASDPSAYDRNGGVGGGGSAAGDSGTGALGGGAGKRIIDPTPCEPTLDSIERVIFQPSCSADFCHGATRPAVTLSLTVDDLESSLVEMSSATCDGWTLVVPGSPEQSFLYQKVTQSLPACGGDRMPYDAILPDNQIECIAGWIRSLAPDGCEMCGGASCVSLASDPLNCGACQNACPTGTTCSDGTCACPGGELACDGGCVKSLADPSNCGACGTVCPAGSRCSDGVCTCTGSLDSCSGACVDLTSDPAHCGDCGVACGVEEVCLNSACSSGCGSLTQCDASCVDLKTSPIHCGVCNSPCSAPESCVDGACSCPSGQNLCGNECVDTQTDANNCGACGASCGPGATCASGTCQCGTTPVSFANQVQPIFNANCNDTGCHAGGRPKEGLSLESGKAYAELAGVATSQCGGARTLVVPGQVSQSYLMNKLLGTDLCSGSQMPKAGQSLSATDLATISGWICQGAPNN